MAEQTTVTGFFPVVKNNNPFFTSHPAKRRKTDIATLDSVPMVEKPKAVRPKRTIQKPAKTRGKADSEMSISRLLSAAPVASASETTSLSDGHAKRKRKSSKKQENRQTIENEKYTIESNIKADKEVESDMKLSGIKVNPWISEQAKLVLAVGRGCAAIQASTNKNNLTSDSKTLKASDVFKSTKSSKDDENKGNVRDQYLKKFHDNIKTEGRGRLRQKYSHLLKPDADNSKKEDPSNGADKHKSKSDLRIPAHQRFKQLVNETPEKAFILPQSYKSLLEMFRSVDSVLFLLHRRSETCTFERLKSSVQSMLGRKFTEKHLAQMKTVFPSGLILRIEKNLRDLNGMPSKPQLTIDANFEESLPHPNTGSKCDISQSVLITRRHLFEAALINITKKHHQQYLKELNVKISDEELQRWHPHFNLNKVPEIEEALLPQVTITKTVTSAKDILGRAHCIPQVEKALQKVAVISEAQKCISTPEKCQRDSKKQTASNETSGILKGVSLSLLQRIKEKEMKRAEMTMLQDPKQEKRLALMERLPDIVRIVKTYFTSEKKAAIPVEDCVTKILQSFGTTTSKDDIEEQIKLLNELVPDWLNIVLVRKCQYVKISKTIDVNDVIQKLQIIKKERKK